MEIAARLGSASPGTIWRTSLMKRTPRIVTRSQRNSASSRVSKRFRKSRNAPQWSRAARSPTCAGPDAASAGSMRTSVRDVGRFPLCPIRRALDRGDLFAASTHAKERQHVGLAEAFELALLILDREPARYERGRAPPPCSASGRSEPQPAGRRDRSCFARRASTRSCRRSRMSAVPTGPTR